MTAKRPSNTESDVRSSKDGQPASPETLAIDVHVESAGSARRDSESQETQPGTHSEGRSWQSRRPESGNEDDKLDQALKDSFPTSDPPQPAQPGVTGWDLEDGERSGRMRDGEN